MGEQEEFPRALVDQEAAVLDWLLAHPFTDVARLRAQAASAVAIGRCACSCARIHLLPGYGYCQEHWDCSRGWGWLWPQSSCTCRGNRLGRRPGLAGHSKNSGRFTEPYILRIAGTHCGSRVACCAPRPRRHPSCSCSWITAYGLHQNLSGRPRQAAGPAGAGDGGRPLSACLWG